MNALKNEDFEQAKHIRDILERKSLPGIQEEEKEDYSHFIGQWEETAGGYVYLSRFDGKQAQQKSGNTGWLGKGGVDKDFHPSTSSGSMKPGRYGSTGSKRTATTIFSRLTTLPNWFPC